MQEGTLVLSVKPRFARKLLAGEKTVELRRVLPRRTKPGDIIILYSTAPVGVFVGFCHVAEMLCESPETLWRRVSGAASVTRAEFFEYFETAKQAVGIVVERPVKFENGLSLRDSREHAPDFVPPQSFRYASSLHPKLRGALNIAIHGGAKSEVEALPAADQDSHPLRERGTSRGSGTLPPSR